MTKKGRRTFNKHILVNKNQNAFDKFIILLLTIWFYVDVPKIWKTTHENVVSLLKVKALLVEEHFPWLFSVKCDHSRLMWVSIPHSVVFGRRRATGLREAFIVDILNWNRTKASLALFCTPHPPMRHFDDHAEILSLPDIRDCQETQRVQPNPS